MELIAYWRLLIQNRILVGLCTLLGFIASVIITATTTPLYQSNAQLFVSTPAAALDISTLATGGSFSQQRVKSYAQIINSPMTLKPVIEKLELLLTPEELAKQITSSAPLDTVLIDITVTDPDPALAADIANAVTDQFGKTVAALELRGMGSDSIVKVSTVQNAIAATSPTSPKRSINYALGFLLGFGLGIGIASLRRLLDNSVKNEDDLTGTPLLAAVGFDNLADEKPLITQIGRYAARTEAFRTIRTNLQYLRPDSPPKVIVVTSALPNEGKTTSAMNLALSLSQAGSKVLLMEADLRRPKISIYMEFAAKATGLTEILSATKSISPQLLKKNIHRYEDSKLDVLPSGVVPPNPAELLASHRFDKLIAVLRKKYQYVIIDCPPLLPVTDAAIVSARVDGSILVVHAGVTKKPQFTGARDAMVTVGSSILGVILNMIPESSLEYEYGYRYGYPRYYGNHYLPYGSKKEAVTGYQPRQEDLNRIEREDSFQHIKGKRFKEELMKDAKAATKSRKEKI